LTRAAERECTRTTDVSKDIHSGDAAIHSGGATKDACSGVSSADARDVTAEPELKHEPDIMQVSASTRDATVQTLPTPTVCENISQPRSQSVHQQSDTQSERAPTSSLPTAQMKPRRLPAAQSSSTKTHTEMVQLMAPAAATYAQTPAQCHI